MIDGRSGLPVASVYLIGSRTGLATCELLVQNPYNGVSAVESFIAELQLLTGAGRPPSGVVETAELGSYVAVNDWLLDRLREHPGMSRFAEEMTTGFMAQLSEVLVQRGKSDLLPPVGQYL